MHEHREHLACAPIMGQLLICGGRSSVLGLKDAAEAFDLQASSWVLMPHMIAKRCCHCAASIGRWTYVCGGYDTVEPYVPTASVECFDAAAATWSWMLSMKVPRAGAALAVLGRKLYIVGGWPAEPTAAPTAAVDSVESFDAELGIWETKPTLTSGRGSHAVALSRMQ